MNLLFQTPINTQPISLLNQYQNRYIPGQGGFQQNPEVLQQPFILDPLGRNEGAGPTDSQATDADPNNGAGVAAAPASMTTAQIDQAIAELDNPVNTVTSLMTPFGLQNIFSKSYKAALEAEKSSRQEFGADGHGNNNMSDPTAEGGIGGSAGDAAATGSGGFGPDMGGDGGFGLAGGGYVGYAIDNNPSPVSEHGTARDNVMLPMNSKEGVLPPDVMEYIGVDGLNDFITEIRAKAQNANKQQDAKNARLGLLG